MANGWDCYATTKRWLINRSKGKYLSDYFNQYPYKKIAIYGVEDTGKLLYEEIKDSNCEIVCFIDKSAEGHREEQGIPVILLDERKLYDEIDAIIISSLENYDEVIEDLIKCEIFLPLVLLRDIIYEL